MSSSHFGCIECPALYKADNQNSVKNKIVEVMALSLLYVQHSTHIFCLTESNPVHTVSQQNSDSWSDCVGRHVLCDQWAFGSR